MQWHDANNWFREMHLFKFYVDADEVPVMKYKKSVVESNSLPSNRPSRCLWKKDSQGRPMLSSGCPKPTPFKPVWSNEVPNLLENQEKARRKAHKVIVNKSFILLGLEKYIQYWQNGMTRCEGFGSAFGPYVEYWKRVLHELKEPLPECLPELLEGFWPKHDWKAVDDETFSQV